MNRKSREIDPDEILIDSSNLPEYDKSQLEGRLERPISRLALVGTGLAFMLILVLLLIQALNLEVIQGDKYLKQSENNLLEPVPIFASRGAIFDRNGVSLVWNAPAVPKAPSATATTSAPESAPLIHFPEDMIPQREYKDLPGLAHVLGYVKYPSKDKNGFYYQNDFEGIEGAERFFNDKLTGANGSRLVEVDARGLLVSESVVRPPVSGETATLSIDSRLQSVLYENIKKISNEWAFSGGAGVIMDVNTGEIIALTSYPEYSPQVMSDRTDQAEIKKELANPNLPFLDRAVGGLYTPGSIVKPYVALGALNEHVIEPSTIIVTVGSVSVPNPYDPEVINVFRDWKNHGALDMRRAIAVSSDAYFYIIGGGYHDQKGLGIANIDKYLSMFGLGQPIPKSFVTGPSGVISTPAWKLATFKEPWYLGDTYHSVIGQYGTQVTPSQVVRAVAAVGNRGTLLVPTIMKGDGPKVERVIDLPSKDFNVVQEGMRLGVTDGTSYALNAPYVEIAAKSGTAELGVTKANVNSWHTGYWPYKNPHYAFAVILEHGSTHNIIGAGTAMRGVFDWMRDNAPEYLK